LGLTKPRPRKAVSQATISKLSKAMGDPSKTIYGVSLGGRVPPSALGSDRFLPADMVLPDNYLTGDGSHQASIPHPDGREKFLGAPYTLHEIMKDQTHVDSDRSKPIKVTSFGNKVKQALKDLQNSNGNNPKAQKVIDDAYHQLIIAPQIKAQEEELARQKKAKELEYATLKMRVIELEKQQTPKRPTPTGPAVTIGPAITKSPTSYLPIAVVGIIIVVILLFLRRRA